MRSIVVDDDKLSRKVLEEFINKTESLKFIASYSNPVDAINDMPKIKDNVDLVFLDIEMPEMSGIDFLKNLSNNPYVIIVSSKGKYALEAFEYDVTDYLLKPISYSRFFKAVNKVIKRAKKDNDIPASSITNDAKEIFIKKNSSLVRLEYDDILYIEALENYVMVVAKKDKFTIHITMKGILEKLPTQKFKRVHRSYIVNVNAIKEIEDNAIVINVSDGKKIIPIGKSYRNDLMNDLNLIAK